MALDSAGGVAGAGISLQQLEGRLVGLDKLASTAAGAASPAALAVDTIGNALHLPDPIKEIAKIALGVGTGDIAGIISGALGFAADLVEELAKTQYHPPCDRERACDGYARPGPTCGPPPPPPSPCPPPPCGPRVDPELLQEKRALEALSQNFGAIDNAGGFWFPDGRFSGLDMAAVARGDFPAEMKEAVRYLQRHPDRFARMDRADGIDGLVSRAALCEELGRVNARIAEQQGGHPASTPAAPGVEGGAAPPPAQRAESLEDRMMCGLGAAERELDALQEQALQNPDDKELQLKLQKAQDRVRALFEMLSNMIKQNHEMRLSAIRNMGQ